MTTLIFVRHGQSTANWEKIFAGQTDVPLTSVGERQAENTARFLRAYPIEAVYSSDLQRAMQTAEPTARLFGLHVIPTPGLREIDAGAWEGLPYETLTQRYAAEYDIWKTDCGRAHPEGGESVLALAERIYATVEQIERQHRGGCVAMFSHATPIRLLRAKWEGFPPEELARVEFCGNASVSVVETDENGDIRVKLCGYDAHQGDLATGFLKGIV